MDRKQKSSNNLGSASSVMSNTSGTVGSVRSGKSSKPPTRGNFSYDTKPDATASNATSTMVTKIETLFRIKHKCVLSGAFDRLIPLSVYAKSPELRASLDKVMPGILSGERNAIGGLSTNNESSLKEIENEEILGGELTELADDVGVDMKSSLDVHTQKALDERAAKSVIRLSNAIMPLLDFYNSSMDTTVLAPKASTTPTKNKIKIGTARNNAASNALGLPSVTVVQEVHHAFHAVLKQIHRLETSTTTAVTSDTEVLHDTAKTTTSSLPPPPPPLVDVMMQENNDKVYAHIASLEKQLHSLHDSKKRQYENMLEQLRASERQNGILKKKLEVSQEQREEFLQVAVDKEKQLQAALVHLGVAQEEIKNLKIQNNKIPQQKREHQKEANRAAQQHSKYNAAQFIKLTAQIDTLREELRLQHQRSHEEAEKLKAAAEEASSKAAYAEVVITQLQSRIANSDYFVLHPSDQPLLQDHRSDHSHLAAAHSVVGEEREEQGGSPTDLDDSNLYVDAPGAPSSSSAPLHSSGGSGNRGGGDVSAQQGGGLLQSHSDGLSTISSGSSKHGTLESASDPAAENAASGTGASQQQQQQQQSQVPRSDTASGCAPTVGTSKSKEATQSAHQSVTPSRASRAANKASATPLSPSASGNDRPVRESVVSSPTRASYHRTLATVEQFAPPPAAGSVAGASHNTSMNVTGYNTTAGTLHSGMGHGDSSGHPRQPWRPSTPNPPPDHIRTGYYQHVRSPKGFPVHAQHLLQEDGFMFNNSRNLSRSDSRSPVRSIRPKKISAGASGSNSVFNDTNNSRQRSASLSPFRRSVSPSSLYAAHHRTHHDKHAPLQSPNAKVYRELNQGKCTYCTHNLLELWTRKFGPPIGAPTEERATHDGDGGDNSTSSSSGNSSDGEEEDARRDRRRVKQTPSKSPHTYSRIKSKKDKRDKKAASKAKGKIRKRRSSKRSAAHATATAGSESEESSEESTENSSSSESSDVGGAEHSHQHSESHASSKDKRAAGAGDTGKPHSAVLDSAGNSISYALGRNDSDDQVSGMPLSGKIKPHLLPPRIETARSISGQSPHASVHWQAEQEQGQQQGQQQGTSSAANAPGRHLHKSPSNPYRDASRHNRESVDEMSAITETSEQDYSPLAQHSEHSEHPQQPHQHRSASADKLPTPKHTTSSSSTAVSGTDARSKAGTALSMGIADAGMSPPPPPPPATERLESASQSWDRFPSEPRRSQSPASAPAEHQSSGQQQHGADEYSQRHPARATPVLHDRALSGTPHAQQLQTPQGHMSHLPTDQQSKSSHHSAHHQHAQRGTPTAAAGQQEMHIAGEPAVDSSNDTLLSFPVGPANSATSQHTAQLLQKLRARNIHPKTYLTTSDTRNTSTAALTTQCNQVIREFNEILMTLGNELLLSESVKLDYKQEIHESANLVSELQKKVTTLQSENDSLYETISASQVEKEKLSRRHEELVFSIQEELLQARVENEDLVEEAESLKNQLFDTMSQNPYSTPGGAPSRLENADRLSSRSRSRSTSPHHNQHRDQSNSRTPSPHHGHTARLRSHSSAQEENALHREDQHRIALLEEEIAQFKSMNQELSVEQQRYKDKLFTVEVELAEARQKLTDKEAEVQSLHQQVHKHQNHAEQHEAHHRAALSAQVDTRLADLQQKVDDTEAISQVQSQLLQQKDFQVQQLKDNIFTQQQQYAALQQQHLDMHSRLASSYSSSNHNVPQMPQVQQVQQVQQVSRTTSTDHQEQQHTATNTAANTSTRHTASHTAPPVPRSASADAYTPHSQAHSIGIAAAAPADSQSERQLSQLEALRQQLDATHRELEEVKRANQQGAALHLTFPTAGSSSSSVAGSVGGSLASSVRGNVSHSVHAASGLPPASPMSVNSAMSTGSSLSSHLLGSSVHGGGQQNAYQGDLQYISHLDVIMEEGSVRTGSGTNPSAATPAGGVNNVHGIRTPIHGMAHNDDRSRASQHSYSVQGQGQDQNFHQHLQGQQGGSVQSDYSNHQQGTPLHTMLRQHYTHQQNTSTAEEDNVSDDMNRQITSMTATNAALTSRVTQLEQRLRHSELRCKLLMDQIKSMPVSLSVAQAEKRVIECKLEKATETYTSNIKKLQDATSKKIHELTAYLQIERAERAKCEQQLQEQKETIHQLSHHMKIVRTQQQVTSQQEYTLPELHSIFGGHGQGYSTFDIGGTSSSGGNNQNSKEMFPEFAHPAHSIPHGAHTNSHANTHTNTAAEAFHLSRTVPLTPLSLSKPDARAHNSHHTSAHHHSTDPHYGLQTPSHGHTAGVGAAGGSSSVRGGTNHNYSDVNIIRSSIPPAPWEVGSLYAH